MKDEASEKKNIQQREKKIAEAMAEDALIVTRDSSKPSDVTEILKEALDLPLQTGSSVISFALLLLFPFTLIVLLVLPLMQELQNLGLHDCLLRIPENFGFLLCIEGFFFFVFLFVTQFRIKAILRSGNLEDLLLRFRSRRKISMKTWVYFSLVTVAYMLLVVVSVVALAMASRVDSMGSWTGLVGVLAAVFYLILVGVWMLGFVNSILEEDCYALKKLEGFVLVLFLLLLSGPISVLVYLKASANYIGISSRFAFGCLVSLLFFVSKLFICLVYYTVLYCHEERLREEKAEYGSSLVPENTC